MSSGLAFERRLFQGLFATADQKEGESRSLLDMGEKTVTSWVSRAFGRERSLTFLWERENDLSDPPPPRDVSRAF
jgi:hypothetical protein